MATTNPAQIVEGEAQERKLPFAWLASSHTPSRCTALICQLV